MSIKDYFKLRTEFLNQIDTFKLSKQEKCWIALGHYLALRDKINQTY